ncbi:MAG: virulence RhuM family protein [Bacteroidales bacterium]|nr:virulence RhuM family protein [Bacteroidales bacterium]
MQAENRELLSTQKNKGEIVLYQPDENIRLEVRLDKETVWLTQQQIADLFGVKQPAVSKHIANIYKSGELDKNSSYSILEYMGNDGKQLYTAKAYNLDMILSVGYRVNSVYATRFRQWANAVLKKYLLEGYAINQQLLALQRQLDARFEKQSERILMVENELQKHHEQIDFFVRTALPPVQGVFFDGQIFDAYAFASDLIRSARKSIVLIDNYVDSSVLIMLSKRATDVSARIITRKVSEALQLDIEKFRHQYAPIEVEESSRFHDRFLIIDETVYHIGASLKDLGKKLFAFSKMDVPAEWLEP